MYSLMLYFYMYGFVVYYCSISNDDLKMIKYDMIKEKLFCLNEERLRYLVTFLRGYLPWRSA